MTRKEFFDANPDATFEDYKDYLEVVINLTEQLGRLPTEEEIQKYNTMSYDELVKGF